MKRVIRVSPRSHPRLSAYMQFQIITPERVVFSDEVEQVSLPTRDGEITVMPHHIPLVTILQPGELRYKKGGDDFFMAVSGGFAEVRDNGQTLAILADTAEHAHEIDVRRAEEARERAEKLMSEAQHREDIDYAALQSKLEKELARLRVGNKYRRIPKQPG